MSYDTRPGGSASGTSVQGPSNGAGVMFWPDEFISDEPFLHPGPPGATVASADSVVLYEPDAPPTAVNAASDEFDDSSIGGAWIDFDPGAVMVASEDVYGLKHVNTGAGSAHHLAATVRAFPAGSWSATVKVDLSAQIETNFYGAGIVIGEDMSGGSTTANLYTIGLLTASTGVAIRTTTWSGYDTPTLDRNIATWYGGPLAYVRFVYTSGTDTIATYVSSDGMHWELTDSSVLTSLNNPIAAGTRHVGVFTDSVTTGGVMEARYRFFRVVTSGAGLDPLLGKRVNFGAGAAGAAGVAGINGPAVYLEAEAADEPWIIPGPQGIPGVGTPGATGPAVYLEADLIEPDFFVVPGPAGPPSTAPGPAIFLEADVIEPDFFVVPGKDGAKGADGAPGTGGGGGASMPLGVAPDEIADEFIFVAPPQPTIVMFQQEISLGATALRSGKFTVTDARIKSSSLVICQVAAAAYTSKGVMTDEADLQGPIDFAVLPAAGSATVYWASPYAQYGNIKFNFLATAG